MKRYASFMWEHLGREEGVILPAAQRYLTDEKIAAEIDAAFVENRDPRFGHDGDVGMHRLFSRIVNLSAPASASWCSRQHSCAPRPAGLRSRLRGMDALSG